MKKTKNIDIDRNTIQNQLILDAIHKIKNSLGGISGFAALLERELEEKDSKYKMVLKVQDGVQKVNYIAISLMTLASNTDLNMETFQLAHLLKQIWSVLQINGKNSGRELIIDPILSSNGSEMKGDRELIKEMITRLSSFVTGIKGKIERMMLLPGDKNGFEVRFAATLAKGNLNDSYQEYLDNIHAIEPRLELSIANKIAYLHSGDIVFNTVDENRQEIIIVLPKEKEVQV